MSSTAPPDAPGSGSEGTRRSAVGTEAEGIPSPGDLINQWRDDLFGQIRRRPTQSLLVAVGAGYLAGGGLGTILTARLLALGSRLALRAAVVPIVAGEIERALFDQEEPRETGSPVSKRATRRNQVSHDKEMET